MNSKLIAAIAVMVMMVPVGAFSRVNSLTGGVSISYDYDDRSYETIEDDPDTPENEAEEDSARDGDYQRLVLSPMAQFISRGERDSFELRVEPGINYDLLDYDTEWDNNFYVAADRFVTRTWQLGISNQLLRSDYFDPGNTFSGETSQESDIISQSDDPQLSPDPGRSRYWRNTLDLFSDYHYLEDSLFRVGFNYNLLRNDDTGVGGYEDYDRYTVSLLNEYRFNPSWNSILDLSFVRGDFEPADREVVEEIIGELDPDGETTPTDDQLSNDLNEYHLLFTIENNSIVHNPLLVTYNYIGSKYEEALRDDSDIHQMRFSWRHDFSPRMYSNIGIGPSYEKTEGLDANWGGNGTVELDYRIERGSFNFLLDKRYDVNNFSGNDQRGLTDIWDTRLSFNYQLLSDLSFTTFLSYVYQDRDEVVIELDLDSEDPIRLEEYHEDRYIAGLGFTYTFLQFYSAGIDYTFNRLESDRIGDDYDDHRLLFTLSWQKELFHW